jgi:hypothetical protein
MQEERGIRKEERGKSTNSTKLVKMLENKEEVLKHL